MFIGFKAILGQTVTIAEFACKFDELLHVQGHIVFPEYREHLAQKAKSYAQIEFDLWRERVKHVLKEQRRIA